MAINNHEPSVHSTTNTHLQWTGVKRNKPLFKRLATSSHGQGNRKQFMEISYTARIENVLC
jgi:hypothetical protein